MVVRTDTPKVDVRRKRIRRKTRPAYPVGAKWKSLIFEMYVFNCRLLGTHVIYTNRPIVAGMKTHTLRQKLAYDATDSYAKVMHLAQGSTADVQKFDLQS